MLTTVTIDDEPLETAKEYSGIEETGLLFGERAAIVINARIWTRGRCLHEAANEPPRSCK
jgi:hypothetical protein